MSKSAFLCICSMMQTKYTAQHMTNHVICFERYLQNDPINVIPFTERTFRWHVGCTQPGNLYNRIAIFVGNIDRTEIERCTCRIAKYFVCIGIECFSLIIWRFISLPLLSTLYKCLSCGYLMTYPNLFVSFRPISLPGFTEYVGFYQVTSKFSGFSINIELLFWDKAAFRRTGWPIWGIVNSAYIAFV